MSGFEVSDPADRGRKRSIGEQLDAQLALNEQSIEALCDQYDWLNGRVKELEHVVKLLEQLLLGAQARDGA